MNKLLTFTVIFSIVIMIAPPLLDRCYNSYDENAVKEKLKKMVPDAASIELTSKNHTMYDVWTVKYPDKAWISFRYSHGALTTDSVVHPYICGCN